MNHSERKQKTHRVAGAFWWIEAAGRIALRSLGGGEVQLFTDAKIRSILDAFEDATVEPLVDCWIYQVRYKPRVAFEALRRWQAG